ncbi:hypothetical protein DFQ29_000938 [Apophysomyces sp. BC1021]|nr:hypothetical protein DFQ29_000938 [Apophysomyces sp. BC1021]
MDQQDAFWAVFGIAKQQEDVQLECNLEDYALKGVDPGSTKEFYHLDRYNTSRSLTEQWKMEKDISSKKTVSVDALKNYIVYIWTHRKDIYQFYDRCFASLQFGDNKCVHMSVQYLAKATLYWAPREEGLKKGKSMVSVWPSTLKKIEAQKLVLHVDLITSQALDDL